MKIFNNFIRFFALDTDDENDRLKNYHEPRTPMNGELIQKPGDIVRFLVPKSDIGTVKIDDLRIGLYGKNIQDCQDLGNAVLIDNIGYLRRQQSELRYEMTIKINNAPDGETWKQFSLLRPNGDELFGTFTSQETDFEKYVEAYRVWLETFPHVRVDSVKDGNMINILVWESGNFRIRNEEITVGLGLVSDLNTNAPQLTPQLTSTYNRPAYYTSDLVIGNDIQAGNVFTLGSVSYEAKKYDTPESIKKALLGTASKVISPANAPLPINVALGTTKTKNTNNPTIIYSYDSTGSGQDKYKIEVENVQKGNIFQVLISTEPPLYVEATDADTKTTIEAILNPDSGFLSVNTGATIQVNAVPGVREDANTNFPIITTENEVLTPTQNTDRYKIIIGTSVKKNNKFTLKNTVVTAIDDDTFLTIAQKLNLIDGLYFEVPAGQTFDAYAEKGPLYDETNLADVQLISSPIRRIAEQFLCEVKFPTSYAYKVDRNYQICISQYEKSTDDPNVWEFKKVLAVSNRLKFDQDPKYTMILRYADLGQVFGSDYMEKGLAQQIRVPIYLKDERIETQLTTRQSVSDDTVQGDVLMKNMFDFVVDAYPAWFHKAMQNALNCRMVFLDNKRVTLINYKEEPEVGAKKVKMATGSFYETDYNLKNYGKLFLDLDNYQEKVSIFTNFAEKITTLVLFNDDFRQDFSERGEQFVPPGEYHWKVFVCGALGDTVGLRIYHEGNLIHETDLFCGFWNKLDQIIRLYHGQELMFEEISGLDAGFIDYRTKLESTKPYDSVSSYKPEIGGFDQLNGYVNPFKAPITDPTGKWRWYIDENFNLLEQVLDPDQNWITKNTLFKD